MHSFSLLMLIYNFPTSLRQLYIGIYKIPFFSDHTFCHRQKVKSKHLIIFKDPLMLHIYKIKVKSLTQNQVSKITKVISVFLSLTLVKMYSSESQKRFSLWWTISCKIIICVFSYTVMNNATCQNAYLVNTLKNNTRTEITYLVVFTTKSRVHILAYHNCILYFRTTYLLKTNKHSTCFLFNKHYGICLKLCSGMCHNSSFSQNCVNNQKLFYIFEHMAQNACFHV